MSMEGSLSSAAVNRRTALRTLRLSGEPAPRRTAVAELLVHALAQLPERFGAELPARVANRPLLELIASAYGVENRVRFVEKGPDPDADDAVNGATTLAELIESLLCEGDVSSPANSLQSDDRSIAGHRVAIVTNLPTHYRVSLFNALARRCRGGEVALQVLFLARSSNSRRWLRAAPMEFDHRYVAGIGVSRDRSRRVVPLGLERALGRFAPTMVLCGGFSPAVAVRVAAFAQRRSIPCGIWSGEIAGRSTAGGRLRTVERRWLLRRTSFAVAYGSQAASYLRSLQPDLPLVIGRNSTEIPQSGTPRPHPELVELLAVARAEREKALDVAIAALGLRPDLPCRLTIAGGGRELELLKERAAGDGRIRFVGAVPSDEIHALYQQSDVFLFPSRYDAFGLAVVEAMGAGLATVLTRLPGVAADLCVSGRNCLLVDPADDLHAWASAIGRLVADHDLRRALGSSAAKTIASRWTIEHSAEALWAGLRLAGQRADREQTAYSRRADVFLETAR